MRPRSGFLNDLWSLTMVGILIVAFLVYPQPFINGVKYMGGAVMDALSSTFGADEAPPAKNTTTPAQPRSRG